MRARGHTVMEVVVSLAILTILIGAALGGEEAHRQTIAMSFDRLDAGLAASSHLERLREGGVLVPGRRLVALDTPGAEVTEGVREIEPGLYEVQVVVFGPSSERLAELTTRIAREESR